MMQRTASIFPLVTLLAVQACGDWRGPRAGEVAVDTLDSGIVRVRNPDSGLWGDAEEWRLVEDLRIGAAEGEGPDVFGDRIFVQVDDAGGIYVADVEASEIRVFGADGGHLHTFGRPGDEPGEFRRISGMDWGPDGRLRVMDGQLTRLSIFDADGTFRGSHNRPAGFVTIPWRGRVDRQGRVYDVGMVAVNDLRRMALVRFDTALVPLDTLVLPPHEALTFDATDEAGRRARSVSIPFAPTQVWHIAPDGTIWIGVTDEYRLHQIDFEGDTLRIVERRARQARITTEERQAALDELEWFAAAGGSVDASRVPDRHPLFNGMFTDDRGHLWVAVGGGRHQESGTRFDVFDPVGRFLGPVAVDGAVGSAVGTVVVRDGSLYAVVNDEVGAKYVLRYWIAGS
jgi:sugar lactone lactonase YvrE